MHFEQRRALAERRAAAEARDPVARLSADAGAHGVDAVLEPAFRVEPEIGGRIAERSAAPVARNDRAGDEPGMADELRRLDHAARGERGADRARGHRTAFVLERRQDLDREAEPLALGGQKGGRAAPVLAVMEIEADRHALDREPADQDAGDEILGRERGERRIEGEHQCAVEPARGKQAQLGGGGNAADAGRR